MSKTAEVQSPEYMPHGPAKSHAPARQPRPVENLQTRAEAGDQGAAKELAARTAPNGPTAPQKASGGPPEGAAPVLPGVFNPAQVAPKLGAVGAESPAPLAQDPVAAIVEAVGGKLTVDNVRGLIVQECDALKALLLEKNEKYGSSFAAPQRVFSKASAVEQILVRIDDKISRIKTTGETSAAPDEDTVKDLIGYLILLRVAQRLQVD